MVTVTVSRQQLESCKCDLLILPVFEEQPLFRETPARFLNHLLPEAEKLLTVSHFSPRVEAVRILPTGNNSVPLIAVLGCGKIDEWDMEKARRVFGKIYGIAKEVHCNSPTFYWDATFPLPKDPEIFFPEVISAVHTAAFQIKDFKQHPTEKENEDFQLTSLTINYPDAPQELEALVERGMKLGEAVNFARRLGELPGNILTPERFVQEVVELDASLPSWKVEILDKNMLEEKGLNALLAVARGSQHAPFLAIIQHTHPKAQTTIGLVGKGVTFDSGGISIKPSKSMDEMKYDMSGAGLVLATMKLIAELNLPINVVAGMPLVENMPSGSATRPGDIVTAYNGKSIEILNTDAEGRLILADALAYVDKNYQPAIIVDFATLTGAIIVALGHIAAGLFTEDENLAEMLIEAGEVSGDRLWQLPLWDDYKELMKGKLGDLRNISSKPGAGSITAAIFLKEFVEQARWAHIDIAGTAWDRPVKSYQPEGATGFGVRLLFEWIQALLNI